MHSFLICKRFRLMVLSSTSTSTTMRSIGIIQMLFGGHFIGQEVFYVWDSESYLAINIKAANYE